MKDGINYVIDGQQRLTTITLLLIYLKNLQEKQNRNDKVIIDNLIYSEKFGRKSFNFEDPNDSLREKYMDSLYCGEELISSDRSETIQKIVERYHNIEEIFPESLQQDALPYFIDWLIHRVELIEIIATTNDDAYTIFETMNDRGLSLKPVEKLKGYLLTHIKDQEIQNKANNFWKKKILDLNEFDKEEDSNFIKTWFRAKFAESIRERKKNAINKDFELISNEFYKWLRENKNKLNLKKSRDFLDFIMNDFNKFSFYYILIRRSSEKFDPEFEYIYYNASNNFTLQYPLLLAPLKITDNDETNIKKIKLVSAFLDIFIVRRIVNNRTLRYSSILYTMFNLIKEIRDLNLEELYRVLKQKINDMEESFENVSNFKLHNQNRRYIHTILARMTFFIEKESKMETKFENYVSREIKRPFEIEHIWGDKYEQHEDEFSTEEEFSEFRQMFGDLLLLPRGFNQSLGADTYEHKVDAYFGQNLLAKTLNELCYKNNPSFKDFLEKSGLSFHKHFEFKKKDIEERQKLYQKLCEYIWNPSRLDEILT